jgi:hypothetical protein
MGKVVTGKVTPYGYDIIVLDPNTGEVFEEYSAGNSLLSSSDSVKLSSPWCMTIPQILSACNDTAHEIAKEQGEIPVDVRLEKDW